MSGIELKPCPHCGHPKARIVSRTQCRGRDDGLVAYEYVPNTGFGGDYEEEVPMLDFRHSFYVRCNKCGARGPICKTPWHERTVEEADSWSRNHKYWGFESDSDWAKPARDAAAEAWNRRAERTCKPLPLTFLDMQTEHIAKLHLATGTVSERVPYKRCSRCGGRFPEKSRYCPKCGAKVVE